MYNFLNASHKGMKHKIQYSKNSNSEDALTWSCFDFIRSQGTEIQVGAIKEMIEDAYSGENSVHETDLAGLRIDIGKEFVAPSTSETTEVDASIESDRIVIFFEAKLYSALSLADPPEKPYNQIARKLRVGLDYAQSVKKTYYFVVIDIAPVEKMRVRKSKEKALSGPNSYRDKWKTAWWYDYYKKGRNNSMKPLEEILTGIDLNGEDYNISAISRNMGWLTWGDLFKITLRSAVPKPTSL